MSITYAQALSLCREINSLIGGTVCDEVLAISLRTFLLFFVRGKDKLALRLCFQDPFLRFHLDSLKNHSQIQLPFANELSKAIHGMELAGCRLLNEDRILELTFRKGSDSRLLIAELFPRRPNFYLLDTDGRILFSMNSCDQKIYELPAKSLLHVSKKIPEDILGYNSNSIAHEYAEREKQFDFLQKHRQVLANAKRVLKRSEERLQERESILKQCQNWEREQHDGQLLQANLYRIVKGQNEISLDDWESGKERILLLDPLIEPFVQVSRYFQRAKKLRLGIVHAERQVILLQNELRLRKNQYETLVSILNMHDLDVYCRAHGLEWKIGEGQKTVKRTEAPKPYHQYISQNGVTLWVGKSAKDNDRLTFLCANGSDWWLHAHNYPGSHVVIHLPKDQEPDSQAIEDAAELALRYSKVKNQTAGEVCLSQVKFLKRVKSSPGKVMLSKHKVLHVVLNQQRWQRLKDQRLG